GCRACRESVGLAGDVRSGLEGGIQFWMVRWNRVANRAPGIAPEPRCELGSTRGGLEEIDPEGVGNIRTGIERSSHGGDHEWREGAQERRIGKGNIRGTKKTSSGELAVHAAGGEQGTDGGASREVNVVLVHYRGESDTWLGGVQVGDEHRRQLR